VASYKHSYVFTISLTTDAENALQYGMASIWYLVLNSQERCRSWSKLKPQSQAADRSFHIGQTNVTIHHIITTYEKNDAENTVLLTWYCYLACNFETHVMRNCSWPKLKPSQIPKQWLQISTLVGWQMLQSNAVYHLKTCITVY